MCYQSYIVVGHTKSVKLQILPLYVHALIHSAKQPMRDISYTNFLRYRFNMLNWPKSRWRGLNSVNGAGHSVTTRGHRSSLIASTLACLVCQGLEMPTMNGNFLAQVQPGIFAASLSSSFAVSSFLFVNDESLKMSQILSKVWLKYYQMCLLLTHNLVHKVHAMWKMPWILLIINSSLTITVSQLTVPTSVEHFQKA